MNRVRCPSGPTRWAPEWLGAVYPRRKECRGTCAARLQRTRNVGTTAL